jgi:putative redox protein
MSDMKAFAKWTEADRFVGAANSGHEVVMDAGSDKTAVSPVEMVLIALCSCTASDVVSILRKKREPFTAVEVRAESERAPDPPRVFTKIKLIYRVAGKVNRKSVEDAVRLSMEKYCSVGAMLKKSVDVSSEIELV